MKVCLVSLEHINRNFSLSGGALRVAGIMDLLQELGHEVHLLRKKREGIDTTPLESEFEIFGIREDGKIEHNLNEQIQSINPDCLIVEQWGLLDEIQSLPIPILCDFHGSLIWENNFRGYTDRQQVLTKLYSLQKCDGFLVPGERQYYYFLAWAMMAGVPMQEDRIFQLKLHLPRDWYPIQSEPKRDQIICGGGEWPWVKLDSKDKLVEEAQKNNLRFSEYFYSPSKTGLHPGAGLEASSSGKSHAQIVKAYYEGAFAFDCYHTSRERQLAITTRTIEYLHCHLPVIYSQGLELSQVIQDYDLGVVVGSVEEFLQSNDSIFKLVQKQNGLRERLGNYLDRKRNLSQFDDFLNQLSKVEEVSDTLGKLEFEKREWRKEARKFADEASYFRDRCAHQERRIAEVEEEKANYKDLLIQRSRS